MIGPKLLMTRKVLVVVHFSWEIGWSLSYVRSRIQYLYLLQKQNTNVATISCCTQVMWMKQNLRDIRVVYDEAIPTISDNTNVIKKLNNPMIHSRTKHISIKYHFLKEKLQKRKLD